MQLNNIPELKQYLAGAGTAVCRLSTDFAVPYNWSATLQVLVSHLKLTSVRCIALARVNLLRESALREETSDRFAETRFYLMGIFLDSEEVGPSPATLRELELRLQRWFPTMADDLPVRFVVSPEERTADGISPYPLLPHLYRRGVSLYRRPLPRNTCRVA